MSVALTNVGGTLTGGSTVNLSFAGNSTGTKASFLAPTSTRLAPKQVDFYSNPAKTSATDPGVARGGLKITFADRQATEGCCGVQAGSVIIDLGIRWSLNQPESLLDAALDYLQSAVFSAEFISAVKTGALPA